MGKGITKFNFLALTEYIPFLIMGLRCDKVFSNFEISFADAKETEMLCYGQPTLTLNLHKTIWFCSVCQGKRSNESSFPV